MQNSGLQLPTHNCTSDVHAGSQALKDEHQASGNDQNGLQTSGNRNNIFVTNSCWNPGGRSPLYTMSPPCSQDAG